MARSAWMLMLVVLFVALGCEQKSADRTPGKVTPEDVRRDAGHAIDTTAEYSRQTMEEFQKKLETQLNDLDAKIDKLRDKGRDLQGEAKAKWDRKIVDLEKKRDAARDKLAKLGHSSAEAWKDVQKGAQSAWDELDKAFRDASREF
jgi:TolA-binding protein